ncbi:MAG: cardiolipin synthase [Bacteroidetes bacterium]|nr:cardiolipin synthase [Bacteroidota bacterium]
MHLLLLKYYPFIIGITVLIIDFITAYRIIIDTHNSTKTLAYLLLVFILPVIGSAFYFSFGINYRKKKIYSKKVISNDILYRKIMEWLIGRSKKVEEAFEAELKYYKDIIHFLMNDSSSLLSLNKVTLLLNGENKFESVLEALKNAKTFIHLEYYIFENDTIGKKIIEILKTKAGEGVKVRFIYDDFGSHRLKNILDELRSAGIEIFPFYKIRFFFLANRINYRNHRKIIVIDGVTGFIGGINVSDRYINTGDKNKLYWRDTHLKIEGPAVNNLQYHFIANWNFASNSVLDVQPYYFPLNFSGKKGNELVQIVPGGPDYPSSGIMLSFFTAIVMARQRIYITSPYFIPNDSICDALRKAALSGKDVRLLLPGISDSRIVNAAARSYFYDMLKNNVKIYLYQKGFIHAKTMVVDDMISIVGTANMDVRSFDLNFEINAVVYGKEINRQLTEAFMEDLTCSEEITFQSWLKRGSVQRFVDASARLLSPLL